MQAIAKPAKPGVRRDSPVSPIIHGRQKISSTKRGVPFNGFASHERSPRTHAKVNACPSRLDWFESEKIRLNRFSRFPTVIVFGCGVPGVTHLLFSADLRSSFEELGFERVRSYVQSGSVVFETSKNNPTSLSKGIREKILGDYGFPVPLILRTSDEMKRSLVTTRS
jgi:hypothetical protein